MNKQPLRNTAAHCNDFHAGSKDTSRPHTRNKAQPKISARPYHAVCSSGSETRTRDLTIMSRALSPTELNRPIHVQPPTSWSGYINEQSPLTESNCRPFPYHGNALPTELRGLSFPYRNWTAFRSARSVEALRRLTRSHERTQICISTRLFPPSHGPFIAHRATPCSSHSSTYPQPPCPHRATSKHAKTRGPPL